MNDFLRHLIGERIGTEWDSQLAAASEERGYDDEDQFQYVPPLRFGFKAETVADFIIAKAVSVPNFKVLRLSVLLRFCLSWEHSFRCIDRVLGGLSRATTRDMAVRPDSAQDPLAAVAFDRAMADRSILDRVYPEWEEWIGRPEP